MIKQDMTFEKDELVELFYEQFESQQNTDEFAMILLASCPNDFETIVKAQQEACTLYNKYCY